MNKSVLTLVGIVVVIIAAVLGLAVWLNHLSPKPVEPDPNLVGERVTSRPYSHMTGKTDAKVTLVEFGDFQCPFCAQAYPAVKQVVDKYKSNQNFNFIFRHFPLTQHPNAQISAEAAEASGAQGKFFEMVDLLYPNQNDWAGSVNPTNTFINYAEQLGLDANKFGDDLKNSRYINQIFQDEKDGEAWGVTGTPTLFLNGQKIDDYAQLDSLIGSELTK